MKKVLFSISICFCILVLSKPVLAESLNVKLNGEEVSIKEYEPYIDINNRAMVSVRWVAEQLNYNVKWDNNTEIAIIEDGTLKLQFSANASNYIRQKDVLKMDTPAVISGGRLFVPIRYIAEGFGLELRWNQDTKTIYLLNSLKIFYEDSDLKFGVLLPGSLEKNEVKITKSTFKEYTTIEFADSKTNALLFSLFYYDLNYWNEEVEDNFSLMYTEIEKYHNGILICVQASDVQYDIKNISEKERYNRLLQSREEICSSAYFFTN
jgi:hypothetical protein